MLLTLSSLSCTTVAAEGPICVAETTAYRNASAYLAKKHVSSWDSIALWWSDYYKSDGSDALDQRYTLNLMYAEIRNLVRPEVAPDVRPEVVEKVGTALRCVKDVIRLRKADPRLENTKGLDQIVRKQVAERLGMEIDLGDPL
jgi:hypothetical protein